MRYNINWTVAHAEEGGSGMAEKKRISVRIAGRYLSMMTDEDAASVREIEKELNTQVEELGRANPWMATREGKTDAVILCAFEALAREKAAAGRIGAAEQRAVEAERQYRLLLEEYNRISAGGAPEEKEADPAGTAPDEEEEARRRETLGRIRDRLARIRDGGGTE